jgi:hypothetical protein
MKMNEIFSAMVDGKKARTQLLECIAVNKNGVAYVEMPHPYSIYSQCLSLGDVIESIREVFPEVKEVIAHFCGQVSWDKQPLPVKVVSLTIEEEAQRWRVYQSTPINEFPEIPGLKWAFDPQGK